MEWEFLLLDWIQLHLRTAWADALMPAVSALSAHGEIWILLAAVLLIPKRTRRTGLLLTAALLLEWAVCNGVIKPLVARTRPYDVNTAVQLIAAKPHDYSFPSGHSGISFAAASALYQARSRLFWPAVALAAAIAFSRLYLYMHFPTDVAAGILLGWLCGWLAARFCAWWERRHAAKQARRP